MILLTRCYRFAAAHVLRHPALSETENRRVYGKCAHPSGHGHDYGLEVTVTGPVDVGTGQLADRERLDALVQARVLDRFSHRLLNDTGPFRDLVPTAENIARVAHAALAGPVAETGARLVRVGIVETRRNQFSYGEPEFEDPLGSSWREGSADTGSEAPRLEDSHG
jgi:6-pyruvoyltetrahydropterin/6-carboxytetrahydropterin synthase